MLTLQVPRQEALICEKLFARLAKVGKVPLIDKYQAYQVLDDYWQPIAVDLEILQTEGFDAARVVDPNYVIKKKDGKDVEVQEGWKGRILPFELVQKIHFATELESLRQMGVRLDEIGASLEEIIQTLSEADGEYSVLNGTNDKFSITEARSELKEQLGGVTTDEIRALRDYCELLTKKATKSEKLAFIAAHSEVDWGQISANQDGTFGKSRVEHYILSLQCGFDFQEDSFADKLMRAIELLDEEKELKDEQKRKAAELHLKTKTAIEQFSDAEVHTLLEGKWVTPLVDELHLLPGLVVDSLIGKLEALVDKYRNTFADNAHDIRQAENSLASMLEELDGSELDLKGLAELKTLLTGD